MLTRIYGTAFFTKGQLEEHLERIEQARERDHRKLGRELGLFTFSEISPGAAFWLPAGTSVYNALVAVSREMGEERGYSEVKTPQIYDAELWKTSGHWEKYSEHMFTVRGRGPRDGRQADELPRPRPPVREHAATPTATCRCATSSRACCIATSPRECCTGCCGCATSPRTTDTSSAPRSRSRRR